ncbi:MAG: hypothetical protein ACYDDA_09045 [Acidiferrobacteraceae bacterium]
MSHRRFLNLLFGFLLLASPFVAQPASAGIFIGVSAPIFAFSFGEGVGAYWAPAYGGYIYNEDGNYLRWTGIGWVYTPVYGGPWAPLPPDFVLPPMFAYGPPPPIVVYRPYFLWWRAHVGPWYAEYHPRWWLRYHPYLRHYDDWRMRVVPYYAAHPHIWEHPAAMGMRPHFFAGGRRFQDNLDRYRALRARRIQNRQRFMHRGRYRGYGPGHEIHRAHPPGRYQINRINRAHPPGRYHPGRYGQRRGPAPHPHRGKGRPQSHGRRRHNHRGP